MAVLTWQNVNAPDLSGAAQVIGQNGQNIGGAFTDLAAGLGAFNQARQDRADAAAIQAASQITDSAAYTRALKDGSILRNAGIDPNMISGRAAELLAARQKTLLGNDFDQAQIENQRADNEMALKRFEAEQAQAKIDNERSNYRFGREQAANTRADQLLADQDAARQLLFEINQAGVDQAGARQKVNNANVSDRVKQSVLGSLGMGGGVIKLSRPGAAGSPLSGLDAFYSSTSDKPYIMPDRPLSQGTFREAYDFGQRLRNATAGKIGQGDKGTSAIGAFQITGETFNDFAKSALGEDWGDLPFNYENQAKVAEAIFNARKGGNLKDTWASLPDSTPGAYKNMSFEEFQRILLPLESGATLDEVRAQDAQSRVGQVQATTKLVDEKVNNSLNQRLGNIQLDKYQKDLQNDNPDLSVAAEKAIKENPALKGTDLNRVAEWLGVIQEAASAASIPMSASAATHVLGAAMRPDTGVFDPDYFGIRDAASGFIFDKKLVDQTLQDIKQSGPLGRGVVRRDAQKDKQLLAAAASDLQAAIQDMQAIAGQSVSADVRDRVNANFVKALKRNEDLNASLDAKHQFKPVQTPAQERSEAQRKLDEAAARFQTPLGATDPATRPLQLGPSYGPAAKLLEERLAR